MAHLQGYAKGAISNMLNHYTRHDGDPQQERYTYGNQRIDTSRTHLNYALFERDDAMGFINRKINEADTKPNKTTNVISDWIVTLPQNDKLQGREGEFFEQVNEFLTNKVGADNVVGSWVHNDETSPHLHFCFVPSCEQTKMTNDKSQPLRWTAADEKRDATHKAGEVKRDSKGTVRYKRVVARDENGDPIVSKTISQSKMFDRITMQQFHPMLSGHLEKHFGFDTGIVLEDAGDKILSGLPHADYIEAKKTLKKTEKDVQRLEDKRKEIREQTTNELSGLEEIRTKRARTQNRVDVMGAVASKQRSASSSRLSDQGDRLREVVTLCVELMRTLGVDEKSLARFAVGSVVFGVESTRRRAVQQAGRKASDLVVTQMFNTGRSQPQKEFQYKR